MIFTRLSRQLLYHRHKCRKMTFNQNRGKAVQNYKRPDMNEYLAPRESWEKVNAAREIKNNYHLGTGLSFFCFTIGYAYYYDLVPLNSGPKWLYKDSSFYIKPHQNPSDSKVNSTDLSKSNDLMNSVTPETSKSLAEEILPEEVPFLLIGGGTASFSAMRSIRAADPRAKVLIINEDPNTPYMRPPLTKELWYSEKSKSPSGQLMFKTYSGRERSVFFEKESFYTPIDELDSNPKGGISVLKGHKVTNLNPDIQEVTLDKGKKIKYEKCLIATGGQPKTLDCLKGFETRVTTFRSLSDYEKLEQLTDRKDIESIAVIGGGFLGTELAMSLALKGKENGFKVTQLFPEQGLHSKILPEFLSNWAIATMQKNGVNIIPGVSVSSAELMEKKIKLNIEGNESKIVEADHVIVAAGIEPNTELANSARLNIDSEKGGILANEFLQTNFANIYVAGDVASYINDQLGRQRLEHHDNAIVTGKLAGENMAGGEKAMSSQPMFWSDIGQEIGIEGVGQIDSSLETVSVFAKDTVDDEFERGIVFYKNSEDVVVGVLLWNVFNQMSTARRIIREHKKYDDLTEVAKLLQLYKTPDEEKEQASSNES